jgi:hypothetical protein
VREKKNPPRQKNKKQADVIDIVHIAKIMPPESTVFHGVPGTSYSFHDEPLKDVQSHLTAVREWLHREVTPLLEGVGARWEIHLFVDKTTAPAGDVAATILSVAQSLDAPIIVMVRPLCFRFFHGGRRTDCLFSTRRAPALSQTVLSFSAYGNNNDRPNPTRPCWTRCLWARSRTGWPSPGTTCCSCIIESGGWGRDRECVGLLSSVFFPSSFF